MKPADRFKNLKRWGQPMHVKHIMKEVEEVPRTFTCECSICADELTFEATSKKAFSEILYSMGWRVTDSEKYGQIGVTCRDCTNEVENE